ncbi:hypothetical protein TREMEDRAFT_62116 [Tremella mesenterica DSM 1558]|uniref:uncharacterized protein n=1 Tax=Tremella mesenterica (strain ATCC 24925 / CBS 8224 / DSM 1558 / NBRC 9311 / NRRL Y-6157 / RJB 2259-6 / UBC 559-6) TaxID=578456 RepID=UPI0003F49809|nr:uncharacterized protein TREMEDRAFT_62116 [Tremella mesenterica DSM 1558]EIW69261.1 hypothetical protein TREMEDRAFT_62116 [Tremella mesenterica DSM 1558]
MGTNSSIGPPPSDGGLHVAAYLAGTRSPHYRDTIWSVKLKVGVPDDIHGTEDTRDKLRHLETRSSSQIMTEFGESRQKAIAAQHLLPITPGVTFTLYDVEDLRQLFADN